MQKQAKIAAVGLLAMMLAVAELSSAKAAVSNSFDLNACISAINDPQFTSDTLATTMRNPDGSQRYANGDALQSAITAGSINLYVANGPGLIFDGGGSRQDAPDLYC